MRLFDAHSHRLKTCGPGAIRLHGSVLNSTKEAGWPQIADAAFADNTIIPAFGIHPWHAQTASPNWQENLKSQLMRTPSAVGEIGLDKVRLDSPFLVQKEIFTTQLAIAAELNRPAIIHCVKAVGAVLETFTTQKPPACGFLMHAYLGSLESMSHLITLGAYFTLPAKALINKTEKAKHLLKEIPLERLLIESDSDDNQDSVAIINNCYKNAAELRSLDLEELALQIAHNFQRLFAATHLDD